MRANERPVVLVTGGARRVGRVIARTLHAAGYDLGLHYRASREEAGQLAAELETKRANSVFLVEGDLSDATVPERVVRRLVQHFGRLDGLVNNASSFSPTLVGATDAAQWDDLFGSNAKGPFFLSQAAAPHLKAARGAIVNLVDIYAERPLPKHTVYCMAKAANAMLVRSLAVELGPDVRVNGVSPGAVLWPEAGKTDAQQQAIVSETALKRSGEPRDVAEAVLYLLRDARYVTGEILRVDGGRLLT